MVESRLLRSPGRLAGIVLPAIAAGLGVVPLFVVPRSDLGFTTYSGTSRAAETADLAAGLGLLAAGVLVWLVLPASSALVVIGLAGIAWFAPDVVGWDDGPAAVRSVAMVVEPFFLAFVFHLVLAAPGWRLRPKRARLAVAAIYACAGIVSIGRALFRDPFLDLYCWSNCADNVFLLSAEPGVARALDATWLLVSLTAGSLMAVAAIWRIVTATGTARRTLWPVLAPGALVGATTAARAVALTRQPLEFPGDPMFSILFQARAWSVAALALGVGWTLILGRRTRTAVARLASDLGAGPRPGSLALALAEATGDASLEVAYRLPGTGRYVDVAGGSVEPPIAGSGRAVTPIVRDGGEVALVIHDEAAVDPDELDREIGPAARLAIDNERLRAEVLAQLDDLRASRTRIIETADAERRQLERNLHDGAQQRLLALSYDLRRATAEADAGGEEDLAGVLRAARDDAQVALEELRDLAHGIYPAVLAEAGIGPALWTLADSARIPVEVSDSPEERLPEAVERTAFVVVSEAVAAAERAGSSHVDIRAVSDDGRLVVEVAGAGPGPFVHIADRVGAVGGDISLDAELLRVEIPCG